MSAQKKKNTEPSETVSLDKLFWFKLFSRVFLLQIKNKHKLYSYFNMFINVGWLSEGNSITADTLFTHALLCLAEILYPLAHICTFSDTPPSDDHHSAQLPCQDSAKRTFDGYHSGLSRFHLWVTRYCLKWNKLPVFQAEFFLYVFMSAFLCVYQWVDTSWFHRFTILNSATISTRASAKIFAHRLQLFGYILRCTMGRTWIAVVSVVFSTSVLFSVMTSRGNILLVCSLFWPTRLFPFSIMVFLTWVC